MLELKFELIWIFSLLEGGSIVSFPSTSSILLVTYTFTF
jgi:hypothetical protein